MSVYKKPEKFPKQHHPDMVPGQAEYEFQPLEIQLPHYFDLYEGQEAHIEYLHKEGWAMAIILQEETCEKSEECSNGAVQSNKPKVHRRLIELANFDCGAASGYACAVFKADNLRPGLSEDTVQLVVPWQGADGIVHHERLFFRIHRKPGR